MKNLFWLLRREPVMVIAGILAAVSMVLVPPSASYWGYIDYDTLALLFALMAVMAGLEQRGFFNKMAGFLLGRTGSLRCLILILVMLCFFLSMVFTNDLVLIIFVPFAIKILTMAQREDKIIFTVVLQTIAANMGSMLLPVGNPQNLYLYQLYEIGLAEFVKIVFPYVIASMVLLLFIICLQRQTAAVDCGNSMAGGKPLGKGLWVYGILFVLALLAVMRILDKRLMLLAVLAVLLIYDRGILKRVDYCLLLTFVFFFIFVGNLKAIPEISQLIATLVGGRELPAVVLASQVISNVPAAVLLSAFTADYAAVLVGAGIGGLGTIIASMASLISFKLFSYGTRLSKGRYLAVFTVYNLLFLLILTILAYFL